LWGGLILSLIALPLFVAGVMQERVSEARESLHSGWDLYQAHHYAEAARSFTRGKDRVAHLPGCTDLRDHLDFALVQAERAAAAEHLHSVADRLRFMVGTDLNTRKELEDLDAQVRVAWDGRPVLSEKSPLDAHTEEQIRIDLADVACLRGDLAQRLDPHGPPMADIPPPIDDVRTDLWWKHADQGRTLMRLGKFDQAAKEFAAAAKHRQQDFWVHFYGGVCAYRTHRWDTAVTEFSVAIALSPETPEVRFNRALAYAAAGDAQAAADDRAQALALQGKEEGRRKRE
jgi:tetratricopeptide (TPR) repeat protein